MNDPAAEAKTQAARESEPALPEDPTRVGEVIRARRALTAHMRHELHTPLNAIIGYTEILLEEVRDRGAEQFIPDLTRMDEAGKRLLTLVNGLLDTGKTEGKWELPALQSSIRHDLRTPLNAVLGYAEMLMEEAADLGQESFIAELQKIHTAGKEMLALIDSLVRFSEVDAGTTDATAPDSPVSTIVQEVVSTVHPLQGGTAPEGWSGTRAPETAPGSLLVVDDNEINRDLLSRRLEREGYTVAAAENGRVALEMIQTHEYDLVLLDMMMPELNGYQVLQHLKSDANLRHIPVIMISALDEIDSVVRCIELGAEDYLSKPFNPVLLKARIGACLEKKRLRDREVLYLRQIEEEKRRSDELLHVILPHEIVEELKANNTVTPRLYQNVAVLFCDIVGFTPYCEQRRPEEVIAYLQELIEIYEDLALAYDMQKIKTTGDAFMATAGLLRPVENPVLNCVKCGLEMITATRRVPAQWNVRVGIHTGPVMAGVVGHRQYLFDLWGDTVNTAERVESNGDSGTVNVSGTAWEQISDLCCGESRGLIVLKGKGPMELFRVSGLKAPAHPAVHP